jgi:transcriptional regulator with XRE-family HTH domain
MQMDSREIGLKIKERRNILNLQQKDLAELSSVSLRTIIQIENGNGNPSLKTLLNLLKVLGVELQLIVNTKHL